MIKCEVRVMEGTSIIIMVIADRVGWCFTYEGKDYGAYVTLDINCSKSDAELLVKEAMDICANDAFDTLKSLEK